MRAACTTPRACPAIRGRCPLCGCADPQEVRERRAARARQRADERRWLRLYVRALVVAEVAAEIRREVWGRLGWPWHHHTDPAPEA